MFHFIQSIITLRNLAKRHAIGDLQKDPETLERIANMYFPYIILVRLLIFYWHENVSNSPIIFQMIDMMDTLPSGSEVSDWLLVLMWLVATCSRNLLQQWWKRDAQSRHVAFLRLLSSALRSFRVHLPSSPHHTRRHSS